MSPGTSISVEERVAASLDAMLPETARAAVRACREDPPAASPAEEALVAGAVTKRRREFRAGRAAARAALAALGIEGHDLLAGSQREPRWPRGVVGSVAHDDGVAVAVAAPAAAVAALGVDVEEEAPLAPRLWPRICTAAELEEAHRRGGAAGGRWVRRLFGAKEAAFKAQFPATGLMLGFHEVQVHRGAEPGAFVAELAKVKALAGETVERLEGRWRVEAGHLLSAAWGLPRSASR